MTPPRTLAEAFQRTAAASGERTALISYDTGSRHSWRQFAAEVERVAGGLAALGVSPGDTVALMTTNRPEFFIADAAAFHLGATPFSIYQTSSTVQVRYLLEHAKPAVVICDGEFAATVRDAGADRVLCIDDGDLDRLRAEPGFDFTRVWQSVRPDDVLTLIYTSGTTGPPKGVEITHVAMLAQQAAMGGAIGLEPGDRCISYLPTAHVGERVAAYYSCLVFGTELTTVADLKQVVAALGSVHPTVFGAVPRVWEKAKDAIEAQLADEPPAKRRIAQWALDIGRSAARKRRRSEPVGVPLAAAAKIADTLVLTKLRSALGLDQVKCAVTGSASTAPEVFEFFAGIGITLSDVWGLSEAGIATLSTGTDARPGTVGKPLPGVEVRRASDGEAMLRSPWLMRGYRDDPERTAEAIDADGWLHTGDILTCDDDGYYAVVDRKKELIINAAGKNMSPANIAKAVSAESPLIGSVMVAGDARPYNVALIVLDPDETAEFGDDPAVLGDDERVLARVAAAVEAGNAKLSRVEQIKRYRVLPTFWQAGSDELTPTMKLKRRAIAEKYAADIDDLYARP